MNFKQWDKLETEPRLIVVTGVSRTGKSRLANKLLLSQTSPAALVNGDDIRRAMGIRYDQRLEPVVAANKRLMVRALLIRGHTVILDGVYPTNEKRMEWVNIAQDTGADFEFHYIDPPQSPCELAKVLTLAREQNFPTAVLSYQLEKWEDFKPLMHPTRHKGWFACE